MNKAHQAGLSSGRSLEVVLFEAEGEVICRENSPLLGFAVNSKVRNGAGRYRGWLAKHSSFWAECRGRRIPAVAARQSQDADQSCRPLHSSCSTLFDEKNFCKCWRRDRRRKDGVAIRFAGGQLWLVLRQENR